MKPIKIVLLIVCLFMALTMIACTTCGTASKEGTNSDELSAFKVENDNLKTELANLKNTVESMESTTGQTALHAIDPTVQYDLDTILESMADSNSKIEMFSADIEDVRIESINGSNQYVFDINRHRPGWGWEVTMGEDGEGYPVKEMVHARFRVVFNYKSYINNTDDLMNEIKNNPSPERYNFLMINDMVVFITEETGP